jgi:hypothetical protein
MSVLNAANGDTVLIRKGFYREGIDYSGGAPTTPSASKHLTFGSYGDGEVILDGSFRVPTWTLQSGTVYKSSALSGTWVPVAVVVNDVPLLQITQSYTGTTGGGVPNTDPTTITSGSGQWGWQATGRFIWADFGGINPATADIVVPSNDGAQNFCTLIGGQYIDFIGLTLRGAGSSGLWTYPSGSGVRSGAASFITVKQCRAKFNGKAGIVFKGGQGNQVLLSYVYHNVLTNWPRGNGGNANAGGGWPGALNFEDELSGVVRGCVSRMNGGEGIISYGGSNTLTTGSMLFEQNFSIDNWSVLMYMDNQPNDIYRQNFLYRRPFSQHVPELIWPAGASLGGSFPYNNLEKYSVGLMIAEESGSAAPTGASYLANFFVYNNIIVNCRHGLTDYGESVSTHGWKNGVVANNTVVMPPNEGSVTHSGMYFQDDGSNSTGTKVQNNVVYSYNVDPGTGHTNNPAAYGICVSEFAGTVTGIALDYNCYYSANSTNPFLTGSGPTTQSFSSWKTTTGELAHSVFGDPVLADLSGLRGNDASAYLYSMAVQGSGGAAAAAGVDLSASFTTDFTGATRTRWSMGAFN